MWDHCGTLLAFYTVLRTESAGVSRFPKTIWGFFSSCPLSLTPPMCGGEDSFPQTLPRDSPWCFLRTRQHLQPLKTGSRHGHRWTQVSRVGGGRSGSSCLWPPSSQALFIPKLYIRESSRSCLTLHCPGSWLGCEEIQLLLLVHPFTYYSASSYSYSILLAVNMSLEKGEQIFVLPHAQHKHIFWGGDLLWNLWRSQLCSFLSSSCAYWLERGFGCVSLLLAAGLFFLLNCL